MYVDCGAEHKSPAFLTGSSKILGSEGICMSSSSSMPLKAKMLVLASAAVVVVPFAPTPAEAHQFTTASNITIDRQGNRYFGKVASARNSCKRNRQVTLFRTRNGRTRAVERTRTNRNGNWSATARRKGRFHAVVSSRSGGGYGHSHTCRGDRSPTIRRR